VVEVVAGIAFDSPEDCTPPAAEHANMVRAVAAYLRAKGWQAAAGVGILLMFGAYLLRVLRKPKPQAKVREWFSAATRARDVTPPEARPAPAAPRQPSPSSAAVIDVTPGLPPGVPPLAR
jgi:membrane-bound lytic murein transglycosylase B